MLDRERTIIIVEDELPALQAFAIRSRWKIAWSPQNLCIVATGAHLATGDPLRLRCDVDGYKALAPKWWFVRPEDENALDPRFPKRGETGPSSIFHDTKAICAPFNRLAYSVYQGPHNDWGGPENWLSIKQHVCASTLGEMLAEITLHLNLSPGWV